MAALGFSRVWRKADDRCSRGGRPRTLQILAGERRRAKLLGQRQVTRMFQLSKRETMDEAVAKLWEFAGSFGLSFQSFKVGVQMVLGNSFTPVQFFDSRADLGIHCLAIGH